ncbi:MAG: lysophospholipid acyltransferase family protein [Pseudomonadota bacterium]
MAEFIVGNSMRKLARQYPLLQRALWRLDFLLVSAIAWLARRLPIDTASRFGSRIGAWIGPRMKSKSAIYRANFQVAFPEKSEQELDALVKSAWSQAGRILGEYPHLDKILSEPDRLQVEIREPIPAYTDPSQPAVIVSAHVSNWEIACTAMAKLGMPNASLYSPPTNPLLDKMLLDSRQALNCQLLPRDNSARSLLRALKAGRNAGMVMDRRVDDGKAIEFFGHDKLSTILPAKLALKHGCEMVPIQIVRVKDARYRAIFHPPIRPRNPQASETDQAIDMIQQLHGYFEDWIRERPADWFCTKRLWPKATVAKTPEVSGRDAEIDSYAA